MADIWIMLTVIMVPFLVLSSVRIQTGHLYGLLLSGCALIGGMVSNKWIRCFVWYLCIWQVFSLASSIDIPSPIPIKAFIPIFAVVMCSLIYQKIALFKPFYFWGFWREFKVTEQWFRNAICIGAIIQTAIALPQIFGFDFWEPFLKLFVRIESTDIFTRSGDSLLVPGFGTLGIYNALAAYLVISFPFFIRKKWGWFLIPISFVLLMSRTTTAIGALLIGLLIYFGKKKYIWVAVIGAVCFALFENWQIINEVHSIDKVGEVFLTGRHTEWLQVWNQSTINWRQFMFGAGPGVISMTKSFVHSEYLGMLFQYGIVGVVLLSGYIATVDRSDRTLLSAFVIAAVDSAGFYPMHHPSTALEVVVIMGLLERERLEKV